MNKTGVALILLVVLGIAAGMAGCGRRPDSDRAAQTPAPGASQTPREPDRTGWPVIVALGDSLTAGYQLSYEESYPAQLQAELDRLGYRYRVVNAGISGDTTTGALGRLDSVLRHRPDIVIVALGGNDGLRGQSVDQMKANLEAMITRLQREGVTVVLAGMLMPPNLGPEYTKQFEQVYPELAAAYSLPLIPFLLDGVAARRELNLPDGIHPNKEGYTIVMQRVLQSLQPLLTK